MSKSDWLGIFTFIAHAKTMIEFFKSHSLEKSMGVRVETPGIQLDSGYVPFPD